MKNTILYIDGTERQTAGGLLLFFDSFLTYLHGKIFSFTQLKYFSPYCVLTAACAVHLEHVVLLVYMLLLD